MMFKLQVRGVAEDQEAPAPVPTNQEDMDTFGLRDSPEFRAGWGEGGPPGSQPPPDESHETKSVSTFANKDKWDQSVAAQWRPDGCR
ncbi:unnamed protein product [Pleuronectes platessa]|uniref:Uncharacterized protein n=1 Tax=Pleuronectes platessa TaxID=8262 RepID=A0A9N7UJJ6_PLEPL|nr:unnamed protein product [Pleuronectes platessa]